AEPRLQPPLRRHRDRRGGSRPYPRGDAAHAGGARPLPPQPHGLPPPLVSLLPSRAHAAAHRRRQEPLLLAAGVALPEGRRVFPPPLLPRSEEHTSELQSLAYLVC